MHAGGTDLLGCLRDHVFEASKVVSLSNIKSLRGIKKTSQGGMRIGALTTLREVAGDSEVNRNITRPWARLLQKWPAPSSATRGPWVEISARNPGAGITEGTFTVFAKGERSALQWPAKTPFTASSEGRVATSCIPRTRHPPLERCRLRSTIRGPKGQRSVALEDFHMPPSEDYTKETRLGPGEIVTEIVLPPPVEGLRSSYRKVRARQSWDFALAGVALALVFKGDQVQRARVFLSGVAPVPWRSTEVEEVVTGKRLDEATVRKAAEAAVQKAKPLEQNAYKIPLLRGLIEEQLLAIAR